MTINITSEVKEIFEILIDNVRVFEIESDDDTISIDVRYIADITIKFDDAGKPIHYELDYLNDETKVDIKNFKMFKVVLLAVIKKHFEGSC